jgi:hypothetical protein
MLAELADDFQARVHAIVSTWLLGDVEGLALVGDDADELLRTRDAGETPASTAEDRQPDFWLTLLIDLDRRPIQPG